MPFIILSLSGDETGWSESCAWRTKGKMKHRDLRLKEQHPCEDAKDVFEAWKMRANQQPLAEHQIKASLFPKSALNVKGTEWAVLAGLPHSVPHVQDQAYFFHSYWTSRVTACAPPPSPRGRHRDGREALSEVRNASYGSLSFQLLSWLLLKDEVCYH